MKLSKGCLIWFTGLSGSGKTTISQEVAFRLRNRGINVQCLDGDVIRRNETKDLGFTPEDRWENIRHLGKLAQELMVDDTIVLVAAITPYQRMRWTLREEISPLIEVYVNAPLRVCEQRDVKGLYKRARLGEIKNFTGIDDPYEPPLNPELICYTDRESIAQSAQKVIDYVRSLP
jgi:adenylylsulfate kinase